MGGSQNSIRLLAGQQPHRQRSGVTVSRPDGVNNRELGAGPADEFPPTSSKLPLAPLVKATALSS